MNNDNFRQFSEVISTVVDFYRLFEKSNQSIIDVWQEKLSHIENLELTLDYQHKINFYHRIWKDEQIYEVLKTFSKATVDTSFLEEKNWKMTELGEIDNQL